MAVSVSDLNSAVKSEPIRQDSGRLSCEVSTKQTTTPFFALALVNTCLENEHQPGCLFLGAAAQVPTLDGRVLRLPCPEVVSPGYERRLAAEGMPISKNPGSRGDLLIRFKLVFPAFLPQASKVEIAYTMYELHSVR